MCYLLFKMSNYNAHIDIKSLNSVFEGRPVDDRILELLETEEYKKFGKHLEEHVTFEDNIRNPTGIFLNVKEFLEKNGTWTTVNKEVHDMATNTKVTRPVKDAYIPNDPELYVIVVIDHLALMNTEAKINDVRDAMILFSSKYALELRKKRNQEIDDHEKSESHLRNAEVAYLEIADLYDFDIIECIKENKIRSKEDINDELYEMVKLFLK